VRQIQPTNLGDSSNSLLPPWQGRNKSRR
jgi:hypothetical protein